MDGIYISQGKSDARNTGNETKKKAIYKNKLITHSRFTLVPAGTSFQHKSLEYTKRSFSN